MTGPGRPLEHARVPAPRPKPGGAVLETPIGNIPVYNSVREGLVAGHRFNCGVVYLPPSAARDGVAELIRVNPDLRKIFIVTEKIAVHDAREIRAMGQQNGIDIFGANGLGVADSWNQVRIGGALGGRCCCSPAVSASRRCARCSRRCRRSLVSSLWFIAPPPNSTSSFAASSMRSRRGEVRVSSTSSAHPAVMPTHLPDADWLPSYHASPSMTSTYAGRLA